MVKYHSCWSISKVNFLTTIQLMYCIALFFDIWSINAHVNSMIGTKLSIRFFKLLWQKIIIKS